MGGQTVQRESIIVLADVGVNWGYVPIGALVYKKRWKDYSQR